MKRYVKIREIMKQLSSGEEMRVDTLTFNTFIEFVTEHGLEDRYEFRGKGYSIYLKKREVD